MGSPVYGAGVRPRAIHGPKPYKFIGFGDIHGPNPYKCIWFGELPSRGREIPGIITPASGSPAFAADPGPGAGDSVLGPSRWFWLGSGECLSRELDPSSRRAPGRDPTH